MLDLYFILITIIIFFYRHYYTLYIIVSDEEIDSWSLIHSPWPMCSIVIVYLLFVLKIGPKMMESKEAYNITDIILMFNFLQFSYNSLLCLWVSGVLCYDYYCVKRGIFKRFRIAVWNYFSRNRLELQSQKRNTAVIFHDSRYLV